MNKFSIFTTCFVTCVFVTEPALSQEALLKNSAPQTSPTQSQSNSYQASQPSEQEQPNPKAIETITVYGDYLGLETPEVIGRFFLDRDFIEASPMTNGDINDLIALLPGVQISEDSFDISDLAEISAQEISISGAQPWQTGFFIDGLGYNNRAANGDSVRTQASINDVSGGAQTLNVNSQIVSNITVYDHNIPAEFGEFSGGVVDVETRNPVEESDGLLSLRVRANNSDWGRYHIIEGEAQKNDGDDADQLPRFGDVIPVFTKTNVDLLYSSRINKRHGLLFSSSYQNSVISDISLNQLAESERTNINSLLKYTYRDGWIDKADVSLLYAPYTSDQYIKDSLNSDYTLNGGSVGGVVNLSHNYDSFTLSSRVGVNYSENSRDGPANYFSWLRARGKLWGIDALKGEGIATSNEGGYGNLENTQQLINANVKAVLNTFSFASSDHRISMGLQFNNTQFSRVRAQESFRYNGPQQYSTSPTSVPLNCAGFLTDCIELAFIIPLPELAEQLGGQIDFNNPNDLIAYSDNISATPQYFRTRLVQPAENIDVNLNRYSAHLSNNMAWKNIELNLGLRYDYDEFYKNHNVAHRLSGGYDLFNDSSSLITFGASRYYDAGGLSYQIREQQLFSYGQVRAIQNGFLRNWQDFANTTRFRYRFTNVSTPYDDEFVIGFRQATDFFGNYSVKYVKRLKRDQIERAQESILEADGFRYNTMTNNGFGNSKSIVLSWDAYYEGHSFWFNTSFTKAFSSDPEFNNNTANAAVEELVFYEGTALTLDQLDVIRTNFGRPFTFRFGWAKQWLEQFSTSINASYRGAYDTPVLTAQVEPIGINTTGCSNCESLQVLVPVYRKIDKRAVLNLNLSSQYSVNINSQHSVELRFDISNLLNSRSYSVDERLGFSGVEAGTQFWFGLEYVFN